MAQWSQVLANAGLGLLLFGSLVVEPRLALVIAGLFGLLAGFRAIRLYGAEHDESWRRAWGSFAAVVALNAASAIGFLSGGYGSLVTVVLALGGAIATVGAGVALLEHRLSRGRAIDVLFEGVLAALAVALSLFAISLDPSPARSITLLLWLAAPLVMLVGVWLVVRGLSLSKEAPFAASVALMAVAGFFAIQGVQGLGPLIGIQVPPQAVALTVLVSTLTFVYGAIHPSVHERFAPVPVRSAGLARAHVALLIVAIVTAPMVVVWQYASGEATIMPLHLGVTILFPLLVVAHLVRQVQERASGEYRAQHDALTGLPNRVLFQDRLEVSLAQARRQDEHVAVMFIDLDRFKRINDSLGHDVGNVVLQHVAVRLRKVLREEDTVARLGGDEFIVLLRDADGPFNIRVVGDKILEAFSEPIDVDGRELSVGASIGVAMYPEDGTETEVLLKNADIAMYRAKARSRNNLQFYTPEMSAKAQLRLALESALRNAQQRGELAVHYQPRVRPSDRAIVGFEALLRWTHRTLGAISPSAFIPLAEESGLILELGEWVLGEACRQGARWRKSGLIDVPVSVNISARQFAEGDVEQLVVDCLRASGLPPTSLELELTESVLMRDFDGAADLLSRLRALGVRCSIDDFGTGYSGLSYLAKMPIDTLKIDRSFVADMSGEGAPIISAVVALAGSLGLHVVAEGVETEHQVESLMLLECSEMQGYYYSRPLPPEAIERLVRRWNAAEHVDAVSGNGHLDEQVVTRVLVAATSDAAPFDDLDTAHAVLSALSEPASELVPPTGVRGRFNGDRNRRVPIRWHH